jgi:hypothetical protein
MPAKVIPSDGSAAVRSSDRFSPVQDKDTRISTWPYLLPSMGSQHTADAEGWRHQKIIEIEELRAAWKKKCEEECEEEGWEECGEGVEKLRESEERLSFENEEIQAHVGRYERASPGRMHRYEQLQKLRSENWILRTPEVSIWQRLNQRLRNALQGLRNSIEARPVPRQVQYIRQRKMGFQLRARRRTEKPISPRRGSLQGIRDTEIFVVENEELTLLI